MDPTSHLPAASRALPAVPRPGRFYGILSAVVVVFGVVRFACLFNDLWLDEIWSIRSLERISSPVQILTDLRHDNNHPLNSLFLYLLMPAKADWTYRLLSWFTGTAAIGLAGLIARRQFQLLHPDDSSKRAGTAGLMTATIFGGCYLLIHYSSEARGYSAAVAFGLLAFCAMLHSSLRPKNGWAAIYGIACVLGLLSHLVMFQIMLAGLAWSLVKALGTWPRWRDRLVHLACWQLGPWIFFAFYYQGFIRKMEIGGGPGNTLTRVLADLAAYSLGLPNSAGVFIALPVFLAVVLFALGLVWRRDRALGWFYAAAIFIAPALGLWASGFTLLFPRYFIVCAAGALLLAGYALARLWNSHRTGQTTCVLLIAAFLLGNGAHVLRLMRYGRGQYQLALQYVAQHTATSAISLSSDYDDRNLTVIAYYHEAVGPGRTINYASIDQLPPEGSQWLLVHQLDGGISPPRDLRVRESSYQLQRIFPHAALSGWHWYVYRNVGHGTSAP